jgi:hypothetical protein
VKNGKPEILYSGNDLFASNPKVKHMISGDFNGDRIDELAVNFLVLSEDESQSVASVTEVAYGHQDWITAFNVDRGFLDIMRSWSKLWRLPHMHPKPIEALSESLNSMSWV